MKTRILLSAIIAISITLDVSAKVSKHSTATSTTATERSYNIKKYTQLNITDNIVVAYSCSAQRSLTVSGSPEALKDFKVKRNGKCLELSCKPKHSKANMNNKRIEVKLEGPTPEYISINGNGLFATNEDLNTKTFTAIINGSGEIRAPRIKAEEDVTLTINGSGDIIITKALSAAYETIFTVNGSGNINCYNILTPIAHAVVMGSGNIALQFTQCSAAKANVYGSGCITIGGDCFEKLEKQLFGTGRITQQ